MNEQRMLMIMGTGPGSSKSVVCIALCRALVKFGIKVIPFKAICVIKNQDLRRELSLPLGNGLIHHTNAARIPFTTMMNPVVVWPTEPTYGDLYVHNRLAGSVRLLNEDTVILRSLSPQLRSTIRTAVIEAFQTLAAEYEYLIIEGASSPVDLPEEEDLSNILVARLACAPIVLSTQFARGGSAAALIGTALCLPRDIRTLLQGFILSNVSDTVLATHCRQILEFHLNIPQIGIIPPLDSPSTTYTSDDERYEAWANSIAQLFEWELLGLPPITARLEQLLPLSHQR